MATTTDVATQAQTAPPTAAVAAGAAPTSAPVAKLQAMLQHGRPDPAAVAGVLRAAPGAVNEMMALLHQTLGNGFVQQVMATPANEASGGGAGTPLPAAVRAKMEAALGSDFSAVRVHVGGEADGVGAIAYARGNDLHFRPGAYDPDSAAGQELIGHELTHVVQQRNGRVPTPIQAKADEGGAHHDDPGLEAEADAMGARAARGEATGMASSASHASAPAIQRYRNVQVGAEPWRLSEGGRALAKTDGGPGSRTQSLWADAALIGTANGQLTAAGSFVRVAAGGDTKRVILREGGRNAALESEVLLAANARATGDQQADYLASLNTALERNDPSGVAERAHELAGGRVDSTREEMEAHHFQALAERRAAARNTDQTVTLTQVVPTIDRAAAPPASATYDKIEALRVQHGAMYTPHDCNEAARVIMGVSEVARNEQAVVDLGAGAAPHEAREIAVAKTSGETTRLEKNLLTAIADAIPAYRVGIAGRGLPAEQVAIFNTQADLLLNNPGTGMRALQQLRERAPAVYDSLIRFAKINTAADPAVGDALVTARLDKSQNDPSRSPRMFRELVAAVTTNLHVDDVQARAILAASGVVPDMTYHAMTLALDGLRAALALRVEGDGPGRTAAAAQVTTVENTKSLWNKHWGGVIMKDASDFVTLENDASTLGPGSEQVGVTDTHVNRAWGFAMYGTVQPEQTFHHQMMATEDFGDAATTMTHRRPPVVVAPLTASDIAVLVAVRDRHIIDSMPLAAATELTPLKVTQIIKAMKARFAVGTIQAAAAAAHAQHLLG